MRVILDRLLRKFDILKCLSFEVGVIKPEVEIYNWIDLKRQHKA